MKRSLSIVLALALLITFSACGAGSKEAEPQAVEEAVVEEPTTKEFTDDCGRTVTLPYHVTKIAVSGPLSQIYILPIAYDMMVGYAAEFSTDLSKYIPAEFLALPSLGQLYGGKGTMDLEALLAADPDVVIDIGEQKGSVVEDLDGLQDQSGIPFVHIDATVETAADCYKKLGDLLDRQEKAAELGDFLTANLNEVKGIMEKVDADGARKSLVYCLGDNGLNVLAEGSYHSESMNLVSNNVAVIADVNSKGSGNEIDMEQLLLWNPEVIIFAPDSVYDEAGSDKTWNQLDAIKNGNYYRTPIGPYGWLQSPPAVQRYLGMLWLTSLLYPDYCTYNLQERVTECYKLFYYYDLTDEGYKELVEKSL